MVIGVVCGGNLLVLMAMNLDDSGVGRVIFLWFLWQLLVEVNIAVFAIVMFPRVFFEYTSGGRCVRCV